ncbi:MAG: type IV pilus biogenesis/stability protein PilW [Mangrovibacterium sp.]
MAKRIKHPGRLLIWLLICLSGVFEVRPVRAQADPETEARQYFNAGYFEKSLPVFRELVRLYPEDPQLNYFLGASLAETGQYTEETRTALEIAGSREPNALFYLGKYYHIRSDWNQALFYYNQFRQKARKKSIRASSVDELMDLCQTRNNPFVKKETLKTEGTSALSEKEQQKTEEMAAPLMTAIPAGLKDSLIHFQINAGVRYLKIDQFIFDSSRKAFIKGWLIEQELDRKLKKLNALRSQYAELSGETRDSLAQRMLQLEQETYRMNREAREAYQQANFREAEYWSKADTQEIQKLRMEVTRIKDSIRSEAEEPEERKTTEQLVLIPSDSLKTDSTGGITATDHRVIYKIQIGAYRDDPPRWVQNQFRKLSVLRRIDRHVDEKGVTVYTVGQLNSYADAAQLQKQIRLEGIRNASVAAYLDGKRVSLNKARDLAP